MDFGVWIEPVATKFCSSILGTVESVEATVLSTFCAVAPRMKACAGKAAQAEVRFAQTVTQRFRAGLNCVASTALSAGQVGARVESADQADTEETTARMSGSEQNSNVGSGRS